MGYPFKAQMNLIDTLSLLTLLLCPMIGLATGLSGGIFYGLAGTSLGLWMALGWIFAMSRIFSYDRYLIWSLFMMIALFALPACAGAITGLWVESKPLPGPILGALSVVSLWDLFHFVKRRLKQEKISES